MLRGIIYRESTINLPSSPHPWHARLGALFSRAGGSDFCSYSRALASCLFGVRKRERENARAREWRMTNVCTRECGRRGERKRELGVISAGYSLASIASWIYRFVCAPLTRGCALRSFYSSFSLGFSLSLSLVYILLSRRGSFVDFRSLSVFEQRNFKTELFFRIYLCFLFASISRKYNLKVFDCNILVTLKYVLEYVLWYILLNTIQVLLNDWFLTNQ